MNVFVSELISILEQQTATAKELVEALQEDQTRIIKHDIEGLEASNLQKEQIVLGFQALEQSRSQITASLGERLGLASEEVRVSTICPLLGADGEPLERTAEKLRAVIGSLQELIAVGHGFLEQSILGIRSLLSLIHSLRTGKPQTYDASGRLAPTHHSEAVAVRREV